ncbi:MAG: response regulator transcription factor [Spirochaetes bacterium]|nr:response regulator transcription factor [Spirochaetota bacterium]MBU1080618.1 response regulator transcription factor [Spirochaetota bacterium]
MGTAAARKILLVEDEDHIVELLSMSLGQNGFETRTVGDGALVLAAATRERPDLILLDLMLPGLGGLEVCRVLRRDPATAGIPVIMLTAKSEESDKVIGLGIGADDYVTKPFSLRELIARIEAVLRRGRLGAEPEALSAGALSVDVAGHSARLGSEPLALSPTEFSILSALVKATGRTVRRAELVGDPEAGPEAGRALDVHIRNLRKKLGGGAGSGPSIVTVRGVGYSLHA